MLEPLDIKMKQVGDYMVPDLEVPPPVYIGKYGAMREDFLKEHRHHVYTGMFVTGKLDKHLAEINEMAEHMVASFIAGSLKKNPAPDRYSDLQGYIAHMETLTAQAEEIVKNELIYR